MTKKELFEKYVLTKTIELDGFSVTLRELSLKEYMEFKKVNSIKYGNEDEKQIAIMGYFENYLPKLIVKTDIEDMDNFEELSNLIVDNISLFNAVIGEYISFLSDRLEEKKKS